MKFIQLTLMNNQLTMVKRTSILYVQESKSGGSIIGVNGESIRVKETPSKIADLIFG